jgi:DNA ligase-1
MKDFAALFTALDTTNKTTAKVAAMVDYFQTAPPEDAVWAVYFLTGRRLKRLIGSKTLRAAIGVHLNLSEAIVEQCYTRVGDSAETIALLMDTARPDVPDAPDVPLHEWVQDRLQPLYGAEMEAQVAALTGWWSALPLTRIYLLTKLITGALRVGVARGLVVRALSDAFDIPKPVITHRLMGQWEPTAAFMGELTRPDQIEMPPSHPYPYYLASPLEDDPASLGPIEDWQLEWKWDGIRGQLIRRAGEVYLWSRGEELVGPRFPEITSRAMALPDGTVLDGEILAWRDGAPLPFGTLQRRLNRKKVGKKLLADAPVTFMAYDLMEDGGTDLRSLGQRARRARLEARIGGMIDPFPLSPVVTAADWATALSLRAQARDNGVEGLMIKRGDGPYRVGRPRGEWWKWKVDPLRIDAVMIYAQAGSGRRANQYTDYTFAVWKGDDLVPVAKAYSGLSNAEIVTLDRWIRRNTLERFGPVRSVPGHHVFELAFDSIQRSPRHKSGVALRFPRIARWRTDKPPAEADRIETLEAMIRG